MRHFLTACLVSSALLGYVQKSGSEETSLSPPTLAEPDTKVKRLSQLVAASAESEFERAAYANAWIALAMGPEETSSPRSAEEAINNLEGACGWKSILISEILRAVSIETRRIAFFNIPMQLGHTAVEAFIDGSWIFFDPSFGVYVTDENGKPLSFARARALYPNVQMMAVKGELFQKSWLSDQRFEYEPYNSPIIVDHRNDAPIVDVERTYFASQAVGGDLRSPFFTQVPVFLDQDEVVEVGQKDGSQADLTSQYLYFQDKSFYIPLLDRIGPYGDFATGREFILHSSKPRSVKLTVQAITGYEYSPKKVLVDLDHANGAHGYDQSRINRVNGPAEIVLEFTVLPPMSVLRIWSESTEYYVDAYRVSEIGAR